MADVYSVIQAIHQAAADSYDGCEEKIGLRRENGVPITDRRVIDGFRIGINGNVLKISYQTELTMKEACEDLGKEVRRIFRDITKYLKKKYKAQTDQALRLKALMDEPNSIVQELSRTHVFMQAYQTFEIKNFKVPEGNKEGILREGEEFSFKNMLREALDARTSENLKASFQGNVLANRWRYGVDRVDE